MDGALSKYDFQHAILKNEESTLHMAATLIEFLFHFSKCWFSDLIIKREILNQTLVHDQKKYLSTSRHFSRKSYSSFIYGKLEVNFKITPNGVFCRMSPIISPSDKYYKFITFSKESIIFRRFISHISWLDGFEMTNGAPNQLRSLNELLSGQSW